jgi:hypothetical protein
MSHSSLVLSSLIMEANSLLPLTAIWRQLEPLTRVMETGEFSINFYCFRLPTD